MRRVQRAQLSEAVDANEHVAAHRGRRRRKVPYSSHSYRCDGTLLEKGCCGFLSDEDPSKKGKDTKPHPWHSRAYKDKGKQKATLEMH